MARSITGPIGIFDSGVGGLTVASAVKQVLPDETIIYFGDTAHLPYGDKSAEAILHYSRKITDFLLDHDCRVILAACNTVSATVWGQLENYIGERATAMNVIDPVVKSVTGLPPGQAIGVIGTKNTINSGAYTEKINRTRTDLKVLSLATPLLVPMIEEGFVYDDISNAIIRTYLSDTRLEGIDTLILGCTHYPIIKNQIRKFYDFRIDVIDSAMIVAGELRDILYADGRQGNTQTGSSDHAKTGSSGAGSTVAGDQGTTDGSGPGKAAGSSHGKSGTDRFFVSDHTEYFAKIAGIFFDREIVLEKHDLWK